MFEQPRLWVPPVEGIFVHASRDGRRDWDITLRFKHAFEEWSNVEPEVYGRLGTNEMIDVMDAVIASRLLP